MKFTSSYVALAVCFASTLVAAAPSSVASRQAQQQQNGKAVGAAYFITNDESGNVIIASGFGNDGKLFAATATPAGGRGLHGQAQGPDGLFSQGAIKVSGNNLFTVNPGSNTVSMFTINPNDPTQLQRIGDPVSSQGEFPMSLAPAPNGNVCVLNGGQFNSVACFKPDSNLGLVQIQNSFRQVGLQQTTAPTGPAGTASHILFNARGDQLMASFKGDGKNGQGFVAVWDVAQDGSLSENFKAITPPKGGDLPFGMSNHPDNENAIVMADAKLGFDVIDVAATLQNSGNNNNNNNNNNDGKNQNNNDGVDVTTVKIQKRQAKDDKAAADKAAADKAAADKAAADKAAADKAAADKAAQDAKNNQNNNENNNGKSLTGITSLAASNDVAAGQSSVTAIGGQQAVCWTAVSKKTKTFFLSDIGTSTVTEVSVDPKSLKTKIIKQYALGNGIATIDEDVASVGNTDFLYVLAAKQSSIEVVSLAGGAGNGKHIQSFRLQAGMQKAGIKINTDNLQGMTVFVRK